MQFANQDAEMKTDACLRNNLGGNALLLHFLVDAQQIPTRDFILQETMLQNLEEDFEPPKVQKCSDLEGNSSLALIQLCLDPAC